MQALQLWDQPQPASAATGPAAANGAGPGLHVIASTFSGRPTAPDRTGSVWRGRWPGVGDWRRATARCRAGAWEGKNGSLHHHRRNALSSAHLGRVRCRAGAAANQLRGKLRNLHPSWAKESVTSTKTLLLRLGAGVGGLNYTTKSLKRLPTLRRKYLSELWATHNYLAWIVSQLHVFRLLLKLYWKVGSRFYLSPPLSSYSFRQKYLTSEKGR